MPLHPRFNYLASLLPSRTVALVLLAAGVVLCGGGLAGWTWLKARHARNAAVFGKDALAAGRHQEAYHWARRSLAYAPGNLPALEVLVRLGEATNLDALPWMEQAVAADPASFSRFRSLVLELVRRGRWAEAEARLAAVPTAFQGRADTESLRGLTALGQGQWSRAVESFQRAVDLEPASGQHRLHLWTAQLNAPDAAVAAEAERQILHGDLPEELRPQALANLLSHQTAGNAPGASATLDALLAHPAASMDFKLSALTRCMRQSREPARVLTPARRERLETEARAAAPAAHEWVAFLHRLGLRAEAAAFLDSLPEPVRSRPEAVAARAESLVLSGKTAELEALVQTADWGSYGSLRRFVRLGLVGEGAKGRPEAAELQALRQDLRGRPKELAGLIDRAHFWGWKKLEAALLEEAARGPFFGLGARHRLYALYREQGRTLDLYGLMKLQAVDQPSDLVAQNNTTCLGLLLGINPRMQHERAVDFYARHPAFPGAATTLALSHLQRGEAARALELLQGLPAVQEPSAAVEWLWVWALLDTGRADEARGRWSRVRGEDLLPEERALLQRLEERLGPAKVREPG